MITNDLCINEALQFIYSIFIFLFVCSSSLISVYIWSFKNDLEIFPPKIFIILVMIFTYSILDIFFYQVDLHTIIAFSIIIGVSSYMGSNDDEMFGIFKFFFSPITFDGQNYINDIIKVILVSILSFFSISFLTEYIIGNVEKITSDQIIDQELITKFDELNFLVLIFTIATMCSIYNQLEKKSKYIYLLYITTVCLFFIWIYKYIIICS